MAIIPVNNETEYALTERMMAEIVRDAHEHFGTDVRLIRVQDGLQRHALNARTREVRYAFSPQDFGLGMATSSTPLPTESALSPTGGRRTRRRAAALEPFEDSTEDEALVSHEVSLEHLETGQDDVDDDDPYRAADHAEVESFLEPVEEDEEDEEDVEEEAPPY